MTEETAGVSLDCCAYEPDTYVNGAWVPVRNGIEIRVAQPSPGQMAKFTTRPENKELDQNDLLRAFYGEELIREIRGAVVDGAPLEWTRQRGRELMLEKVGAKDARTDSIVQVYKFEPIFIAATNAANNPELYLKDALGNSEPS